MPLVGAKIAAAFAVLAVALLGGLIPVLVTRQNAGPRFLSLGNAFAGGVFLGAGFLHLLPEASEALDEKFHYPLGALLAAVGVCLLLLVDRVVVETMGLGRDKASVGPKRQQTFVLLLVLSVHAVIAGIAVGLEGEPTALLLVTGAILCHKGSAAFALTVCALASGDERKTVARALGLFAAMTPIGICLGMSGSTIVQGSTAELLEGVFTALAAGTFIYVAILDVIGDELSRIDDRIAHFAHSALVGAHEVPMPEPDADRILKVLLVAVGLASMALIHLWGH